MIINEKQIANLIQISNQYLRLLDKILLIDTELLSPCGKFNMEQVAKMLTEINNQQSEDLKVIE